MPFDSRLLNKAQNHNVKKNEYTAPGEGNDPTKWVVAYRAGGVLWFKLMPARKDDATSKKAAQGG